MPFWLIVVSPRRRRTGQTQAYRLLLPAVQLWREDLQQPTKAARVPPLSQATGAAALKLLSQRRTTESEVVQKGSRNGPWRAKPGPDRPVLACAARNSRRAPVSPQNDSSQSLPLAGSVPAQHGDRRMGRKWWRGAGTRRRKIAAKQASLTPALTTWISQLGRHGPIFLSSLLFLPTVTVGAPRTWPTPYSPLSPTEHFRPKISGARAKPKDG